MDVPHVLPVSIYCFTTLMSTDMYLSGLGLSIFASVLQEIFYFKPQTIYVSNVFLCVIAYVLGEALSKVIPRKGVIGKYLNPHPFNMKEHTYVSAGL